MFKLKHSTMIFLSGFVWFCVGCWLLPLGLNFIVSTLLRQNALMYRPVLDPLNKLTGNLEQAALLWIIFCLAIGFFKARFVFAKTVNKSVARIKSLANPAPFYQIYPISYYILLGSMVFLGVLTRFLSIDVRGGVDIIIGSALINGAMVYFRLAWQERKITACS